MVGIPYDEEEMCWNIVEKDRARQAEWGGTTKDRMWKGKVTVGRMRRDGAGRRMGREERGGGNV